MGEKMQSSMNGESNNNHPYKIIPAGLAVKARFNIHRIDEGQDEWLQGSRDGSQYLFGVFTLLNGEYSGCKIYQMIEIKAADAFELSTTQEYRQLRGKGMLRALLNSALGILSHDQAAQLEINYFANAYHAFNNLVCGIVVGIQKDCWNGSQNTIRQFLTSDQSVYKTVMIYNEPTPQIYQFKENKVKPLIIKRRVGMVASTGGGLPS